MAALTQFRAWGSFVGSRYTFVDEPEPSDQPDFLHGTLNTYPIVAGNVIMSAHVAGSVMIEKHVRGNIQVNP